MIPAATIDTSGLDDLYNEMRRMGENAGPVVQAMVEEGANIIRDEWKASAERHGHRDTGAMIESVGFPKPVQTYSDVSFRDIYPIGKDKRKTRNAEKAFVLNYGTSRIRPSYWVAEAEEAAGPKVQARLQEIWDEYLESGTIPGAGGAPAEQPTD